MTGQTSDKHPNTKTEIKTLIFIHILSDCTETYLDLFHFMYFCGS